MDKLLRNRKYVPTKANLRALQPSNIQAGFRKTGIFSMNNRTFSPDKSETFLENNPMQKVKAQKAGKEAVEEFLRIKEERHKQELSGNQCSCGKKKSPNRHPNSAGVVITGDIYSSKMSAYETKRKANNKKSSAEEKQYPPSPKPSTSGLHLKASSPMSIETDPDDEEIDESELCCVCKQMSPPYKMLIQH